ncbi:TPA: hypothetical protein ONV65_001298 [Enterococcus faecium]|nr:hypothetical protein [Enterococcus faecium]
MSTVFGVMLVIFLFRIILTDFYTTPTTILLSLFGLSNAINSVTWYLALVWFFYFLFVILVSKKFKVQDYVGGNAFSFTAGWLVAKYKDTLSILFCKIRYISLFMFLFCVSFVVDYFIFDNVEIIYIRNPCKSIIALLFLFSSIGIVNQLAYFFISLIS